MALISKIDKFHFDKKAADRAVRFFETCLVHVEGEWAGQPFILRPWEKKIVRDLFGWKRQDGTRRYRTAFIAVPRKNGKALALNTRIATTEGWGTMGTICIGDKIFDEKGNLCKVIGTSEIMTNRPCYKMKFSDGSEIIADAEHLWKTESRRTGHPTWRRRKAEDNIHTTAYLNKSIRVKSPCNLKNNRIEWNHKIPVAGSLVIIEKILPLPPYVLGVWLGDGNSRDARVTCGYDDIQIIREVEKEGVPVTEKSSSNKNSGLFRLGNGDYKRNAPQRLLRQLKVLNNKHIPPQYLRSSIMQRMALLQGLMDTDGYISKAGQCEFSTTRKHLAEDVTELLVSLGYKPSTKVCRARIYGKDCGEAYRIQFWSYKSRQVFRLLRKINRLKPLSKRPTRTNYRQIIAVEPIASVPVRCIQVDSSSGLFLAGESMIPTHNSTLSAGLALYLLFADNEPGGEVYSAAGDREQASIVFENAKAMLSQSPRLSSRAEIYKRAIFIPSTMSSYKVLSSEAPTKHGINASGIIFDELHVQPNRELWDTLTTSTGARRQPLTIAITTAGYDRNSICFEIYSYAKKIQEGILKDDSFYSVIFEADKEDDWQDKKVWKKANPNLGVSIKMDYLEEAFRKALDSPAYQNTFRRLHLNQYTEQSERFIDMDTWNACGTPFDVKELEGKVCYAGLDLASSTDIAALVLAFPPDSEGGLLHILSFFWIPEENMKKRADKDRVPYPSWVREGLIMATPGNVIDYAFIKAKILELAQLFQLKEIAYDRWGAMQLSTELKEEGLTVIPTGQGFASLSSPTKELITLILGKRLAHGGNKVLNWMASNMAVIQDPAGNIKPDKGKSIERIDGMVALVMAIDRVTRNQGPKTSVYEERGILII